MGYTAEYRGTGIMPPPCSPLAISPCVTNAAACGKLLAVFILNELMPVLILRKEGCRTMDESNHDDGCCASCIVVTWYVDLLL